MFFVGFVFNTVVLCFLIWLVARKTAQFDFATVFFVTLAITMTSIVLPFAAPEHENYHPLVIGALAIVLLMRFCYINILQAAIVFVLYLVVQTAVLGALSGLAPYDEPDPEVSSWLNDS